MMTPIHHDWSVVATAVRDIANTPLTPRERGELRADLTAASSAGKSVKLDPALVMRLLDAATGGPVIDYEAVIADDARGVVYRARVNDRGDLSRLEVVVEGKWIDDNALRRVPVTRIRREALAHIAEAQRAAAESGDEEVIVITLLGGLSERPTLSEVAQLMTEGRTRGDIHALYPDVPLPTVGRWMSDVRKGKAAQAAEQTTGGK